jgi:hypothetical protein
LAFLADRIQVIRISIHFHTFKSIAATTHPPTNPPPDSRHPPSKCAASSAPRLARSLPAGGLHSPRAQRAHSAPDHHQSSQPDVTGERACDACTTRARCPQPEPGCRPAVVVRRRQHVGLRAFSSPPTQPNGTFTPLAPFPDRAKGEGTVLAQESSEFFYFFNLFNIKF